MAGEINTSGVALVLTLARYFKRWSLWSKDIILLIPADSTNGPQAWVDAYHNEHDETEVESLKIKSGALQGAVAIDYPAGPWGHRYDKLHVVYDGINGQLPNLDLFNTAVQIADGQMGIDSVIQRMWSPMDTYKERLQTLLRGMISQGAGHATGPHSSFMPYHIDAITLVTIGDGWHDEMSLGRAVESLFRSLNNLLEHLHQSFFFYLLLHPKRFVSIGTYLPSAMLIALNFSIMSIALWIKSGQADNTLTNLAATRPQKKSPDTKTTAETKNTSTTEKSTPADTKPSDETEVIKTGSSTTVVPKSSTAIIERGLLYPLLVVLFLHTIGIVPLFFFNYWNYQNLLGIFLTASNTTTLLPIAIAFMFYWAIDPLTPQQITLIQCFSLLLLGMFLAALATLNFSLAFIVGVLCAPLSFVRRATKTPFTVLQLVVLAPLNPVMVTQWSTYLLGADLLTVLEQAMIGWHVNGLWTQIVVFLVWFPAWLIGAMIVAGGIFE